MKERPIAFSGPMVRAILDGSKTQARRVVKPQPNEYHDNEPYWYIGGYRAWKIRGATDWRRRGGKELSYQHGRIGDRLWVREAFAYSCDKESCGLVCYSADKTAYHTLGEYDGEGDMCGHGWKHCDPAYDWDDIRFQSSLFIPRWASRITLEITDIRCEVLREISAADSIAEGFTPVHYATGAINAREPFATAWDALNAKKGFTWANNPLVWVIEFKRVETGGVE
jgi:hypothetical protein